MHQQATDYSSEMQACAEAIELNPPAIVLPEDRRVTFGGLRFHYLDWGNDHLPHLVLLHGGGLTAHTWDMAALLLRERFHVVALDQRGHGDTGWTPSEQKDADLYELMLHDTEAFVDYLGYRRFVLCGMSMGGINAIRYAARHQEHLTALVIVDIAPTTGREGGLELEAFRRNTETLSRFEDFLDRAVQFNPRRHPAHLRYSLLHSLKPVPEGWTWKQQPHELPPEGSEEAEKARQETAARFESYWEDVRAIRTPTLLLRGAVSKILTPEDAQRMVDAIPGSRVEEIPNAGHSVQGDNPRALVEAIEEFTETLV
jgi:pimeloyl-ACP methyl ester carboxylesterase